MVFQSARITVYEFKLVNVSRIDRLLIGLAVLDVGALERDRFFPPFSAISGSLPWRSAHAPQRFFYCKDKRSC